MNKNFLLSKLDKHKFCLCYIIPHIQNQLHVKEYSIMSVVPFQQQGSVDWVALANSTLTVSVDVLSRLSKAGVEHLTIVVAYQLFNKLPLGLQGEQYVHSAVSKLGAYSTFNSALWIGFGVKHIVRTLAESAEGLSCLAICAALAELCPNDKTYAAKVLKHMCDQQGTPPELRPSFAQWNSLASACEGILAGTTFGITCNQMMKFSRRESPPYRTQIAATKPENMAAALLAMGKLLEPNSQIENITVTGGSDCGWLATVAQLLMNLSVEINGSDGTLYYRSLPDMEYGQYSNPAPEQQTRRLVIIYEKNESSSEAQNPRPATGPLTLASRTYSYKLSGGTREIFSFAQMQPDFKNALSFGRVPWEGLIEDVFGVTGSLFLSSVAAEPVGRYLGLLACEYERRAARDEGFLGILFGNHGSRQAVMQDATVINACGTRFITTLVLWFPEIAASPGLKIEIRKGYDICTTLTPEGFRTHYFEICKALRSICSCRLCTSSRLDHTDTNSGRDCIFEVTDIIALMTRLFSEALMCGSDRLSPVSIGLDCFHDRVVKSRSNNPSTMLNGRVLTVFEEPLSSWRVLGDLSLIFAGKIPLEYDRYRGPIYAPLDSAFTHGGVSFAINTLFEATDDVEKVGIVRIAPGKIEWMHHTYDVVRDTDVFTEMGQLKTQYAEAMGVPNKGQEISPDEVSKLMVDGTSAQHVAVQLEVTEDLDNASKMATLIANYRIKWKAEGEGKKALIPPMAITRRILEASFGPRCGIKGHSNYPQNLPQTPTPAASSTHHGKYFLNSG